MKLSRVLAGVLLLCLLLPACRSSKETGVVIELVMDANSQELFARVQLDDGPEVLAWPKVFFTPPGGGSGWKLVEAGQRVEIELGEKANGTKTEQWKILRVLEAGK